MSSLRFEGYFMTTKHYVVKTNETGFYAIKSDKNINNSLNETSVSDKMSSPHHKRTIEEKDSE